MKYLLFVFFIIIVDNSFSQVIDYDNSQMGNNDSYGLFLNYGLNFHTTSFNKLPDVPNCCPGFSSGDGSGISIGGLYDLKLDNNFFISLRAGLFYLNGTLTKKEYIPVLVNDIFTDGEFDHTINSTLATFSIEPIGGYKITKQLSALLGFSIGSFVQKGFSQKEVINQPSNNAVFQDTHTKTRNDTSGTIKNIAPLYLSAIIGLNYELPLNSEGTFWAVPEITYNYGFSNIIKNIDWTISSLRLGIAFKYTPKQKTFIAKQNVSLTKALKIDTIKIAVNERYEFNYKKGNEYFVSQNNTIQNWERTDTLFVFMPKRPDAKITSYGIYENNVRKIASEIVIHRQIVTQAFSILPYIFFNKNSSDFPERYNYLNFKHGFSTNNLEANPLVYYRNLLNIIGERLDKFPTATITLIGYSDPVTENGDCKLAGDRVNTVKNYLISIWGISEDRIKINLKNTSCIPLNLTKSTEEDGYSENRRVEISTDNPEILAPINKNNYIESPIVMPASLEYEPSGSSMDNVLNWKLEVYQDKNNPKYKIEGKGKPTLIEQQIRDLHPGTFETGKPLLILYNIQNSNGDNIEAKSQIKIVTDTSNFEFFRLSLVLFDVSNDVLRESDKQSIDGFIKILKPTDSISVLGFTDKLGDSHENQLLSERRAKNVCDYLTNNLKIQANIVICKGVSFTQFPTQIYSYSTPEERFLCRTVQIEIKRKMK